MAGSNTEEGNHQTVLIDLFYRRTESFVSAYQSYWINGNCLKHTPFLLHIRYAFRKLPKQSWSLKAKCLIYTVHQGFSIDRVMPSSPAHAWDPCWFFRRELHTARCTSVSTSAPLSAWKLNTKWNKSAYAMQTSRSDSCSSETLDMTELTKAFALFKTWKKSFPQLEIQQTQ